MSKLVQASSDWGCVHVTGSFVIVVVVVVAVIVVIHVVFCAYYFTLIIELSIQ